MRLLRSARAFSLARARGVDAECTECIGVCVCACACVCVTCVTCMSCVRECVRVCCFSSLG